MPKSLRLQLPTRPAPPTYADWTWVACPITVPPTVPADAVLHLPTPRIAGGKVRADPAFAHPVPKTRSTGHTVVLGVDRGLNTLLSAGAARLHDDGRITALGTGARFRAAGVPAKQDRLRRTSERLHAKIDHYTRLAAPTLDGKHAVLTEEIRRVSRRRSNLNDAPACSAARWAVDQDRHRPRRPAHGDPLGGGHAGGQGRRHGFPEDQPGGPVQDRPRPATHQPPHAQAT
ncbi:hypothetical protein [Streptomyces sp. NK15101]|uniref:hypothetical protein n=1 Tax=Streptomyces sp. NK15101 TaxID=2873261 RepID=UPI001CECF60F|nr:hypothetical protein [Streptomyces sp. NK15101]